MKLIVDVPEEIYKASQIVDVKYEDVIQIPLEIISNGTPLPKGHGRLIDADAIISKMNERIDELKDDRSMYEASCVETALDMFAPTIIEADTESEG